MTWRARARLPVPGSPSHSQGSEGPGFTLLEVLVSMAVMAVLATILLRLASVAYRVGKEEMERAGVESSLLLASRRLEDDLAESTPAGLSLQANGARLVVHPVDRVFKTGRVLYHQHFLYWSWDQATKRLTRSEIENPPAGVSYDLGPVRWTSDQLGLLPLTGTQRVLLRLDGVSKFDVSNPDGVLPPNVGSPLELDLEVELPIASTRKSLRLVRTLVLRTSGAF